MLAILPDDLTSSFKQAISRVRFKHNTLMDLDVHWNWLAGGEDAAALFRGMQKAPSLTRADLSFNRLSGGHRVASVLSAPHLRIGFLAHFAQRECRTPFSGDV